MASAEFIANMGCWRLNVLVSLVGARLNLANMDFAELEKLAAPNSGHDKLSLWRWTHALQRLMVDLTDRFMDAVAGKAFLCSYTSDATCFLTRTQTSIATFSGSSLQRRGKSPCEFLSERLMLKSCGAAGIINSDVFFVSTSAAESGQTSCNSFQAICDLLPTWRTKGHSNIIVHHFCFDRALHEPIWRLLLARRNALYDPGMHLLQGPDRAILELKDIFVQTGCAAHDGSGSLKWGVARWGGKTVHDNLYMVIRSLRQSLDALLSHLRPWLLKVVVFDRHIDAELEGQWWRVLGVEADWVDDLCGGGSSMGAGKSTRFSLPEA